jgi:hypothetical protein
MHSDHAPNPGPATFTAGTRLSPVHNWDLLDTPMGNGVEQAIETNEEWIDRSNNGPEA